MPRLWRGGWCLQETSVVPREWSWVTSKPLAHSSSENATVALGTCRQPQQANTRHTTMAQPST